MLNLRELFKQKPAPVPGQIRQFDRNYEKTNPFKSKPHSVEVLEVKDGWVRFRHLDSTMWQNESLKIKTFCFCYPHITNQSAGSSGQTTS